MRYENNIIEKKLGKSYFRQKYYPTIPFSEMDDYVICVEGDRLDYIAYSYYKDSELWWIISLANPHIPKGSLFVPLGTQIRIPTEIGPIIQEFERINK